MKYKINAANKILGRLASEVAVLLRGKNDPDFHPGRVRGKRVVVYNTDEVRVTGRKPLQKLYRRHSGYPGGLKTEALARLLARDSRLVLRQAVQGMLPKNRLRSRLMKNLILYKSDSG